jgi:hypothetical protein
MNKIFVVLIIVSIVFISGCAQSSVTQYVCSDGRTVTDKSQCAAPVLTVESELTVCSGMPTYQSYPLEDMCIIGLAGKHQDTSLCKKASRDVRSGCIVLVAEVKNDPTICTQAEQQDQCYQQYATDKKDATLCDNIKDGNYKDSCYQNLASQLGDPKLCDKLVYADRKGSCYYDMAMRLRDTSYCDKIADSNQKQNCLQNLQGGQGNVKYAQPVQPVPVKI